MNFGDRPRVCVANGCTRIVEPRYLFCPGHRASLPPELIGPIRAIVAPWARFDRGLWADAVASAVEFLARLEGRDPSNRFRSAPPETGAPGVSTRTVEPGTIPGPPAPAFEGVGLGEIRECLEFLEASGAGQGPSKRREGRAVAGPALF